MKNANEFTAILKDIMIDKEINQVKLAQKAGVKPSQISEWLSGKSKPGYDSLKALSMALNVSADVLLGIEPY